MRTRYIGTHSVAKMFKVSDTTVDRWIAEGRLVPDHTKLNGWRKFDRARISEMVAERNAGRWKDGRENNGAWKKAKSKYHIENKYPILTGFIEEIIRLTKQQDDTPRR